MTEAKVLIRMHMINEIIGSKQKWYFQESIIKNLKCK